MFSKWYLLRVMEKYNKSALMNISQVFVQL